MANSNLTSAKNDEFYTKISCRITWQELYVIAALLFNKVIK